MRFASFESQSTIAELVDQLFDVPARRSSPQRKAAEQALREANPRLANLRKVPAGTPILVPEVSGIPTIPEKRPPTTPWANLLTNLPQTLIAAQKSIEAAQRRGQEDFDRTTALLGSSELRAAARKDAKLQQQIEQITAAAKTRLEESNVRAEERKQGLVGLAADLKELRGGAAERPAPSKKG